VAVASEDASASGPIALAIAKGVVVLAAENRPLEARSLEDGAVLWTSSAAVTAPVVREGLLFGVGGGELRAIALEKGQPLWTVALGGATPGPGVIADLVVVSSGPELRAYRAADGAAVWRHALPAPAVQRPLAAEHLVVVALTGNEVAAFDRETGAAVWRTPLDSAPSPMAANADRIFFGTASGALCALCLADGKLSQCFRTAPVPSAGAPVVNGASVFFALFDNTLRTLTADGLTLTRLESLPARPALGPLRAGSHLAIPLATSAFALAALDVPAPVTLVSAFDKATGPVFKDGAAAPDGSWLVSLSTDPSGRLSLVGYRRKPAAAPSPNK
jgi:outer membrane protein assembly factor BamB